MKKGLLEVLKSSIDCTYISDMKIAPYQSQVPTILRSNLQIFCEMSFPVFPNISFLISRILPITSK